MNETSPLIGLAEGYLSLTAGLRGPPDFLIVGTQRGGTTSLYRYLAQHPQVVPALIAKGVHYFDVQPQRSSRWYRGHFAVNVYRSYLQRSLGHRVLTGEASPYYLFHPHAPSRAAAVVPDARVIVMLREPVARAVSQHRHEVAGGFEPLTDFEAAIEAEPARVEPEELRIQQDERYVSFAHQHFSYLARGRYAPQVRRWLRYFPKDHVLILSSERFFENPEREFARVTDFLELQPATDTTFRAYNVTAEPGVARTTLPGVPTKMREHLKSEFEPLNRELFDLIDDDLAWGR